MNPVAGLVSVVVPAFGVEPWIGPAIRSVLDQTWSKLELIVVDDGSPDASFEAIRAFSDPRLRVIRFERNRGVAAARNAALDAASGEFVALLDGDDMMHPTRLERQLAFMRRRPDVGLCGGWCRTLGPASDSPRRVSKILVDPRAVNAALVFFNPFCTSSLLMRREAVPEGGFRQRYAEDYDFVVRVAARYRLAIMREVLVDYRLRPGSAMQTCPQEQKKRDVWDSMAPLLAELGVEPTEQEKELHLFARTHTGSVDLARLTELRRWYDHLVRANRRTRVYDDEAFRLAASHAWFGQIYRATGCGLDALRMFFGNPLSFAHPHPPALTAKFLAKAMLGREFASAR